MNDERLTDELAAEILGWRTAPGRFLKPNREWLVRHRFAPLKSLDDAFQLVDRVATSCTLTMVGGGVAAEVQVGTRVGRASAKSKARAVTMALARALGLEVDS
jgi:hypothetical protein